MIVERNEVRGSVVKWRKEDLERLPVISVSALSDDKKERMIKLYDKVVTAEFPALTVQLDDHFKTRTEIDRAWAKVLGWEEYQDEKGERIEQLQDQVGELLHELEMLMENN